MKHLSGQNTILALCVFTVFAISGCFFANGHETETADQFLKKEAASTQTTLATVK